MKDKLNITVKIADQPPIALRDVTLEEEEVIREAEYNINKLVNSWSRQFADKSTTEVLAMVTLRFAQLYFAQRRAIGAFDATLDDFEQQLDKIVLSLGDDAGH